jgi:hypothetical protein
MLHCNMERGGLRRNLFCPVAHKASWRNGGASRQAGPSCVSSHEICAEIYYSLALSSFLVELSIHSFVYHLCASWKFHGSGSAPWPSGVVFTRTDLRWKVAICASSSFVTSMEKRPSEGRWSLMSGESPPRTMTYSHRQSKLPIPSI